MLALKTPLAFIIAFIMALLAYFASSVLATSDFASFLPSIFSVLTVVVLAVVSSLIRSNGESNDESDSQTNEEKTYSEKATDASGMSTLYIGNLAYKANEVLVQEHFEKVGKVNLVRLVKDKKTGRRKGFGFVEISAQDEDLFINKLNETEFMERNIIVRTANDKKH